MPVQTRSQTMESLRSKVKEQEITIKQQKIIIKNLKKVQDVLFFQTATEDELNAFRDLVSWLICDSSNIHCFTNIRSLEYYILNVEYKDQGGYINPPSIKPFLMDRINTKCITPFKVWVGLYGSRSISESWKSLDLATNSEYQYLISWLDENIEELYRFCSNYSSYYVNWKSKQNNYDRMYELLKTEIVKGKLTPIRYNYNHSNLLN
jgi:hypothetical protein